ncbi:MAG: diguanylate cyclase, partial [Magnetococcales bacterium]|nr:diguanylate cyclase [Magnetococcales bacterium]
MAMEEDEKQWVLVADAKRSNRHELSELLKDRCIVALADNGEQSLTRAVVDPQPDLILLGLELEDMEGFVALDRLKRDHRTSSIPVLLVTEKENRKLLQRGLDQGVADFIARPFQPDLIRRRVANLLEVSRQRRMLEQLVQLDGLTGVCNRPRLDAVMGQEWERAVRGGTTLSLVLLDVDHFQAFNEQYGSAMGDRVLKAVARTLQKVLHRPADIAGRFGGGGVWFDSARDRSSRCPAHRSGGVSGDWRAGNCPHRVTDRRSCHGKRRRGDHRATRWGLRQHALPDGTRTARRGQKGGSQPHRLDRRIIPIPDRVATRQHARNAVNTDKRIGITRRHEGKKQGGGGGAQQGRRSPFGPTWTPPWPGGGRHG